MRTTTRKKSLILQLFQQYEPAIAAAALAGRVTEAGRYCTHCRKHLPETEFYTETKRVCKKCRCSQIVARQQAKRKANECND